MPAQTPARLVYGPRKYAGFHLLLCRWFRLFAVRETEYCYVTLGGTELRDVQSLGFIDSDLAKNMWSYELDGDRYDLACTRASQLSYSSIGLHVEFGTFFSHGRQSDLPHMFFLDLPGICAWSDYDRRFGEMFQNEVIREGDCLIITSHLGHNPGFADIQKQFAGEFAVLGVDVDDRERVRNIYRRAHPTMTLFKALCLNRIHGEVRLRCFGTVKYRDVGRTPMGIYGYSVSSGNTELRSLVWDSATKYFDVNEGCLCSGDTF